ncbi:hypothetical protein MCORR_v1c00870 [Mesoplasma corruscae]|uniref:Uncharacterized protein n=1 Tax=Mesoplasma corruscae TaxID=216874 RepID=A0A2S5RGJ4_9MOLU|nr:hypothetical protein MCORR_v1c00870 [Mesoplasma corruscae]
MTDQQIIGLSILVIGVILTIISSIWTYWIKNGNKIHNEFHQNNKESTSIWEFTKKNFPLFLTIFCFIMAFSGMLMMF